MAKLNFSKTVIAANKVWKILNYKITILYRNRFVEKYYNNGKINWRWNILLGYEILPGGNYGSYDGFDVRMTILNQDIILVVRSGVQLWGIR